MTLPQNLTSLSCDELLTLVIDQPRQIAALMARIDALQVEIEQLKRGAKRQAAPFTKGTGVARPKRPGRKPGSGLFCYRVAPLPTQISEPPVDVPVTLDACPACGGSLVEERTDFAYTTDIPALPRQR